MARRRDDDVRSSLPPATPPEFRAAEMSMRGETFMVMSYPIPALPQLPQRLSKAEAEVVRLVVRGDSSEAIATARGTSVRTVANQLASIYRKLGVRSRIELATHLSRIA